MENSVTQSRRSFMARSAAAAGAALTGTFSAEAAAIAGGASTAIPAALRAIDRPVAGILASYGTPRSVVTKGSVSHIEIAVGHNDRFLKSFERLTALSDRVYVGAGNHVTFNRGNTTYIIKNRVA